MGFWVKDHRGEIQFLLHHAKSHAMNMTSLVMLESLGRCDLYCFIDKTEVEEFLLSKFCPQ